MRLSRIFEILQVVGLVVCLGWLGQGQGRAQAAPPALRVLPLGDSVTSGTDAWASYRCPLYRALTAAGVAVDFVGSIHGQLDNTQPPPPACQNQFDWDHEGHSGYRVDDILDGVAGRPGNLQSWAAAAHPDVVLIHLGTNDLMQNESVDSTVAELGRVIDGLRAANPRVKLLLAQIIPVRWNGITLASVPQLNAALPALVAAKARPFSPILLVDQYTGFDVIADTHDGVHPNSGGEQKMTARWLAAFNQITRPAVTIFVPAIAENKP